MPCGASASIIFHIVGAAEIVDVTVVGIGVIPKLLAAIRSVQQVAEYVLIAVFRFRRTALYISCKLLHDFEIFTAYDRFVDILENYPIFRIIVDPSAVFEGPGGGFEIDDISAVFLPLQDTGNRGALPLVGIRLHLLATSSNTLGLPVGRAVQMPVLLHNPCDGINPFSLKK